MRSFQKNAPFCVLLQKNIAFFAFFYILCKRTLHSLRSFTFIRKECIVFWGLISPKNSKKECNRRLYALKEHIRMMRSERKRRRC